MLYYDYILFVLPYIPGTVSKGLTGHMVMTQIIYIYIYTYIYIYIKSKTGFVDQSMSSVNSDAISLALVEPRCVSRGNPSPRSSVLCSPTVFQNIGGGWIEAQNSRGEVGLVPEDYLEVSPVLASV